LNLELKSIVYYHLSDGKSLQDLVGTYPNEVDKREINYIGNTLKHSFDATKEHFEDCYIKLAPVTPENEAEVLRIIQTNYPYAAKALLLRLSGDITSYHREIWTSIKPYGVE
jgi:hypothetical protein